jgi:hypothetical protein
MKKKPNSKWMSEKEREQKIFMTFMWGMIIFYTVVVIILASQGALK